MEELVKNSTLASWCKVIAAYDMEYQSWEKRAKNIVKRYADRRSENESVSRFNILWSNVQTLHPAIYANPPKPNIDRRYQDDDELGNITAQVLERSVSYFVQHDTFDDVMNQCVLDRLLAGRGTSWIRYLPNFKDVEMLGNEEIRDDGVSITEDVEKEYIEKEQELYSEDVVVDYVHWQDFGHNLARTWQEVHCIWRRVYLGKKELEERFGRTDVPLDAKELGKTKQESDSDTGKKATIYELWDKNTRKVYWFHKEMLDFLDVKDDPLKIKDFFPCPKPLFATIANDSLIPTPDFLIYQDQAIELDVLTGRIDSLQKALKIVGVYDSSSEGVQRMLSENVDNTLIPVENWLIFAEKGGLKGVVDYFPVETVANVLLNLYQARDKIKQDIYELTGISDIVRGATNASETATAQKIKGQFATLRLDNMQKEVARYSRDSVRIMAEIIAEHFSLDTIKQISGIKLLTAQEKQQAAMMAQSGQPIPNNLAELLQKPTWEDVITLLRNDTARCFKIDIETDSTIKSDQEAEKTARTEFLQAAGGFIQQAVQVQNPDLQPLLAQMLMFGIRGFKIGREIETTFKVAMDKIKKQSEVPQEPQPNPEMLKIQAEQQMQQQTQQLDMQKHQSSLQFEAEKSQNENALKMQELALKERELALKESELMLRDKEVCMADEREKMGMQNEHNAHMDEKSAPLTDLLAQMQQQNQLTNQALIQLVQAQQQGTQAVTEALMGLTQAIKGNTV